MCQLPPCARHVAAVAGEPTAKKRKRTSIPPLAAVFIDSYLLRYMATSIS